MMFQNGVWSGHDLTHYFIDGRSSISFSRTNRGVEKDQVVRPPANLTSACTTLLGQSLGYVAETTTSHTTTFTPQLPATAERSVNHHAPLARPSRKHHSKQINLESIVSSSYGSWPYPTNAFFFAGGGEKRKRNERSTSASPHIPSARGTLKSPTSKPPPDKKQQPTPTQSTSSRQSSSSSSTQPAPLSKLTRLKSVVSEAFVLPSSPPPPTPK